MDILVGVCLIITSGGYASENCQGRHIDYNEHYTMTKSGYYYAFYGQDGGGYRHTAKTYSAGIKWIYEKPADTTPPTLTITANKTSPTNASSITYTFTFSESVTGFAAGDITVTNGTKGTFSGSGKTYTLVVTNSGSCTQTVSVAAGVCTDAAGNGNKSASKSITIDRTVPTLTITSNKTSPTNASSITYTFTFSESVTGFTTGDISVTNGTKGTFSGSGATYTLVVTNSGNCTQTVSVAAGVCTDTAGNGNKSGSESVTIYRILPTVEFSPNGNTTPQTEQTVKVTIEDEVTIVQTPLAVEHYGGVVTNYTPTNGSTVQWKIFYADDENVYLISDKFARYGNLSDYIYHAGMSDIDSEIANKWLHQYMTSGYTSQATSMKLTSYLLDTDEWSVFKDNTGFAKYAIGGPTLELFVASYNKTHPEKKVETQVTSAAGYQVKWDTDSSFGPYVIIEPKESLYSLYIEDYYLGRYFTWLASPSYAYGGTNMMSVTGTGNIIDITPDYAYCAYRPVICLNSSYTVERQSDGTYKIVEKTESSVSTMGGLNKESIRYTWRKEDDVAPTKAEITKKLPTEGTTEKSVIDKISQVQTNLTISGVDGKWKLWIYAEDMEGNSIIVDSEPYTLYSDTTPPTVTITANPSANPTNASSITYTFTFSENVYNFVKEDITVTNGTKGAFSGSGTTYTLVVTNSGTCTQTISVPANVCNDGVGNGNQAGSKSVTIDRTAPTVAITANPSANPTNASSITYTFTFSENVTGFAAEDITVTNGTKGTFSGSGKTYTLVVTNAGTCTQTISVPANVCNDGAGNGNQAGSLTIEIDRTAPTVAITANPSANPTNASSITYTFTFSKNVTGFAAEDITVTNGTKGTFSGSGTTYTLVVTNTGSCTQTVSVAASKCTDSVGNGNQAGSLTIEIDRTRPTVTITANPSANPTNASSITYTFKFSENVTGFTKDDITVTNGTKGTFSGSGTTYTLVVTNSGSCTQTVSVAASKCTDSVGNGNQAASLSIVIDRTTPTLTITADKSSPTNASSITYTFKFSESVTGFATGDISVANGTKGKFSGSGATYTLVVTNTGSCTQKISVAANVCTDSVGNGNQAASFSIEIDRTVPTLTITADKSSPTNASSIVYTFTFSENVYNFVKDDISVTNGDKGEFSGSGSKYYLTVTNSGSCTQTVSVAANVCNDSAGNGNKAASISIVIDRTVPTVSITADKSSPTNASSIKYTFTFSENVYNFVKEDILVTNGTKGEFSGSGTKYYLTVTNSGTCTQTINVPENVCNDGVENGNKAASLSIEIDRTRPEVTITANVASPTNASSITYTFKFSENVTGFTKEDITVTNGTKGAFSGSGTTYTLVVTKSESCLQKIQVPENVCIDHVGNYNKSATMEMIISIGPFGEVNPKTLLVLKDTTYTTEGNVLTLSDGRKITATPINKVAEPIVQVYFKDWSSASGTITNTTTITANFIREFEKNNVIGSNSTYKLWNIFALNERYYYPKLAATIKY